MGKDSNMELARWSSLKPWRWGSGLFKPNRKAMKVRGADFRKAQDDPQLQDFLEKAQKEDQKLHEEGLIHP